MLSAKTARSARGIEDSARATLHCVEDIVGRKKWRFFVNGQKVGRFKDRVQNKAFLFGNLGREPRFFCYEKGTVVSVVLHFFLEWKVNVMTFF